MHHLNNFHHRLHLILLCRHLFHELHVEAVCGCLLIIGSIDILVAVVGELFKVVHELGVLGLLPCHLLHFFVTVKTGRLGVADILMLGLLPLGFGLVL